MKKYHLYENNGMFWITVDGYFSFVKGNDEKWLDLRKMIPNNRLVHISSQLANNLKCVKELSEQDLFFELL